MTRSKKHIATSTYDSDEYCTTESRVYSKRAYRKNVRDVMSETKAVISMDVEAKVPSRPKRRWRKGVYPGQQAIDALDLKEEQSNLDGFFQSMEESKNNLKQNKAEQKFEEWCEAKPAHVVKKTMKRLERDGKSTLFDEDSTDSETEKAVKNYSDVHFKEVAEAQRFVETESLACFRYYRKMNFK